MLPRMRHPDGISKWRTVDFGGIVHTLAAGNGDIWDDQNIISDEYPVMVTRPAERKISTSFHGKWGCLQIGPAETDTIQLGDSSIKYKGVTVSGSFSALQTMTPFNRFAIIMPAKQWIRTDVIAIVSSWPASAGYGDVYCVGTTCKYWDGSAWQTLGPITGNIEASATQSCNFIIGTNLDPSMSNTIRAESASYDWSTIFEVGDAVTISGALDAENNKTVIIREISGRYLRFYDNTFTLNTTPQTITVARTMPDLDYLCVNENRVWGCKGHNIYASKLGDFKNWNCFDGVATDSYGAEVDNAYVMTGGDFTGCISFMGYPIFFKETGIWKVYGNRPSNFEIMGSASTGCVNGRTLAIANETLYYLSRVGVMAYNGGMPAPVSDMLGDLITGSSDAAAIADGSKYMLWYNGGSDILEYDTRRGMWHKQKVGAWAGSIRYGTQYNNRAALISTGNDLWAIQSGGTAETIPYFVEFADFTEDQSKAPQYGANEKGTSKVQLRMALDTGATATVKMRFDSMGDWLTVKEFTAQEIKRSFYLPIIPRRSDHFRIRIEGSGRFELWSLSRENYKGSALRGGSL